MAKCPVCGSPAYVGFTKVECESPTCVHGKPEPRSKALDTQTGVNLDRWGEILGVYREPKEPDVDYRNRLLNSLSSRPPYTAVQANGLYVAVGEGGEIVRACPNDFPWTTKEQAREATRPSYLDGLALTVPLEGHTPDSIQLTDPMLAYLNKAMQPRGVFKGLSNPDNSPVNWVDPNVAPTKCACGRDLDLDPEPYCSHCIR